MSARRWLLAPLAVGCIIATVIAADGQAAGRMAALPLSAAVAACDLGGDPHVEVLDGGDTLTIDGDGDESPGTGYEDIACLLVAVGTPGSVVARIDRTRALDGTQSAGWSGFEASWTFHPDDGLDILVTREARS